MSESPPPYPFVRSLSRGLRLLKALNEVGRATPAQLAHLVGIDRTTSYRLLATLYQEGYVARSPSSDQYYVLPAVRDLSAGYQDHNAMSKIIAEELTDLVRDILWPSDFMTFEAGHMVVRESTHRSSAYSIYRGMVGQHLPLLYSAAGRAVLAASSAPQVQMMIETARQMGDLRGTDEELQPMVQHLHQDYHRKGYSWSVGAREKSISAIALPVRLLEGNFGAINVMFFTSAMSLEDAAGRYLPRLKACVEGIERRVDYGGGHIKPA